MIMCFLLIKKSTIAKAFFDSHAIPFPLNSLLLPTNYGQHRILGMSPRDIYLVIGGNGFVGRHIVEQLRQRGDRVAVFDIVQRYHDVPFYSGDITEQEQVSDALRKVCSPAIPIYYFFDSWT